jgi:hypothetical protein
MQRRLSDEPPKKTSITIISDVRDAFLFLHRRSRDAGVSGKAEELLLFPCAGLL